MAWFEQVFRRAQRAWFEALPKALRANAAALARELDVDNKARRAGEQNLPADDDVEMDAGQRLIVGRAEAGAHQVKQHYARQTQAANERIATQSPRPPNAGRAERRWQAAFGDPLEAALTSAIAEPAADASPIMQSITGATWRPDFDADTPNRRLVLASDHLQPAPDDFSVYAGGDLAGRLAASATNRQARALLVGVGSVSGCCAGLARLISRVPAQVGLWRDWLQQRGAVPIVIEG